MEETNKKLPRKTYEVPKTNNKTRTYSDSLKLFFNY